MEHDRHDHPPRLQDRAAGALLGLAAGDALGAGYEMQHPPLGGIEMIGGGLGDFAPGEWTDDTSMAVCIARVAATGRLDLSAIGEEFRGWAASGPPDIGVSTAAVLRSAGSGAALPDAAQAYLASHPRGAAGNGALMRTAPVALAHLGDDRAIARAAREVAALTHADPLAGDSCVLWCVAIDRAVREDRLDGVRDGLALLPESRRGDWQAALDAAERRPSGELRPNGFTVTALQAAYAAVRQTPVPEDVPARHLQDALDAAVRIGDDTDTVAAIAGSLLGARWGASAVPFRWRRMLHGWPGLRARDLVRLGVLSASGGRPDVVGWPIAPVLETYGDLAYVAPLPGDDAVLLGSLPALDEAVARVDAVVSLCRVGARQVPPDVEHHEVWLVDQSGHGANPNLDFVIDDAVDAVRTLRAEGKRVFLHCVAGRSRTPTVAAAYIADRDGVPHTEALDRVAAAIPEHDPHNRSFLQALRDRRA
jgi:ADP-ribosyl-[dinitrogen reductase] hydrolase